MADLSVAVSEQLWNEAQLQQRVHAPAFRLWRYRQPVVVLGCSQRRLLAEVDSHTGLEVLLRESGGGAVLTGPWMLGLSVALPPDHPLVSTGPVGSYRWLGEAIAQALRDGGVPADGVYVRYPFEELMFRRPLALGSPVRWPQDRRAGPGSARPRRAAGGRGAAGSLALGLAVRNAGSPDTGRTASDRHHHPRPRRGWIRL